MNDRIVTIADKDYLVLVHQEFFEAFGEEITVLSVVDEELNTVNEYELVARIMHART